MIDEHAQFIASPFYWQGRDGLSPRWVILHGTAGGTSAQGIAGWFQDSRAQVSTHYVIGTDGAIVCCVDENNAAWGNGVLSTGHAAFWNESVNPNLTTISIEHCKPSENNSDQLTEAQKLASFGLIKRLCARWNIPLRAADGNGGIAGHCSIDPVNRQDCPGPYPWQELYAFLNPAQPKEQLLSYVPPGWRDDGTVLRAPNNIPVVRGFREWILTHLWDTANWPLDAEQGVPELEVSNPSLGGGTQQVFRMSMLGWTAQRGVFEEWIGVELLKLKELIGEKK